MNRTATPRTSMIRLPTIHVSTIVAAVLAAALGAGVPARAQQPEATPTGLPEAPGGPATAPSDPNAASAPAGSQERSAAPPDAAVPGADALTEQREAIARLGLWVGEWEGSGWALSRAGRDEFTIHESVEPKLGGLALLVQGLGTSKHPETGEEIVTHDALAVVTWDPEGDRYVFQHYTADGRHGQAELEQTAEGWRWGFRDPHSGVHVRFTAEIGEQTWHERGEVSLDGGATWRPMLEMELKRVGG